MNLGELLVPLLALATVTFACNNKSGSSEPKVVETEQEMAEAEAQGKDTEDTTEFKRPEEPGIAWSVSPVLRPTTIDVEEFEIVGQLKSRGPELGEPIKNATIYVDTDVRGASKTVSDKDGKFRVLVAYGRFRAIRIEAPGFVGEEASRDFLIGSLSRTPKRKTDLQFIYLSPGTEVEGSVVADGQPVKDVFVRCVSKGIRNSPNLTASVMTDSKGAFRVGCPAESVKLLGIHPDFQHGVTDWIDLKQSPDARPTIELKPGARLYGRVLDEEGRPLSQATLSISTDEAPTHFHSWQEWRLYLDSSPFWRLTESDGSFDYGPVSGRLTLRAEANGAEARIELDLNHLNEKYVEITVR